MSLAEPKTVLIQGCAIGYLSGQLFYLALLIAQSYLQSALAFDARTFADIGGSALLAGLAQFSVTCLEGGAGESSRPSLWSDQVSGLSGVSANKRENTP